MADKDKTSREVYVRSYNNAFEYVIFGSRAFSVIWDWVTVFLLGMVLSWKIGEIYPLSILYEWTYEHEWWFVQIIFFPMIVATIAILLPKDGLSFWRWIIYAVTFDKRPFTPFQEVSRIEALWIKLRGEEMR